MTELAHRVLVDLSVAPTGGAGTYVAGFAQGLIDGHVPARSAIVVLLSEAWATSNRDVVQALQATGYHADVLRTPPAGTWRARFSRGRAISRAAERHRTDVVFVPRDVAPRIGTPFVVLARNRYAWERHLSSAPVGGPLPAALLRAAARNSARRASALLAVSATFAESLPDTVNVKGIVHHGCSIAESDQRAMPPDPDGELTVAMVANVMENKGIELVIEGVKRVSDSGRSIRLSVFGNISGTEYAERVDRLAKERLGYSVLRGPAFEEALTAAYRDTHVLVVGGTFETFCFPLIEGMRTGCVVVAPVSQLVDEICGDVAVTYVEGDAESLAGAIHAAERQWPRRSRQGVVHSRSFTWAKTAETTIALVREAVT